MKKTIHFLAFLSLILALLFTSCGPSKKLMVSEAKVEKLQNDSANTHSQLNNCNALVKNLYEDKASSQREYDLVLNDLKVLTAESELATAQSELATAESELTIAEQAKRLIRLQNVTQSQRDVMSKLKNSIADALMNYKTDELYVYIKDGKVYVSLAENLLFKSGSDVVDPKGKEALKSLAQVLNNTNDISVMIEGHTDNVPIKTQLFKDNWDLSTARATSIVRILTNDFSFDSNRITASGRGQFHPVKTNETDEGRAGNRRTEVILSPDLKVIYELLYQYSD